MIIKEYRVLLPLRVSEYQRGLLFAVAETSKNETGGGDGVEVLKQEEFTSDEVIPGKTLTGTYTYKIYHSKSKSPWLFRKILPDRAFALHEESWNAFPYCKTIIKNPDYMREKFYLIIESMHLQDAGETENALNLSDELLKQRKVIVLDICSDEHLKPSDITPDKNPRDFISEKARRGPLRSDWVKTTRPVMCCYKVVQIQFKMFGLQNVVERVAQNQYPRIFTKFNRELYCWIDRWYDMTMEDIRKMEEETMEVLKKRIDDPQTRGTVCDVGDNGPQQAV